MVTATLSPSHGSMSCLKDEPFFLRLLSSCSTITAPRSSVPAIFFASVSTAAAWLPSGRTSASAYNAARAGTTDAGSAPPSPPPSPPPHPATGRASARTAAAAKRRRRTERGLGAGWRDTAQLLGKDDGVRRSDPPTGMGGAGLASYGGARRGATRRARRRAFTLSSTIPHRDAYGADGSRANAQSLLQRLDLQAPVRIRGASAGCREPAIFPCKHTGFPTRSATCRMGCGNSCANGVA